MNYNKMSLVSLKAEAKERGMKNISALKKAELIERLTMYDDKVIDVKKKETKLKEKKESLKEEINNNDKKQKDTSGKADKQEASLKEKKQAKNVYEKEESLANNHGKVAETKNSYHAGNEEKSEKDSHNHQPSMSELDSGKVANGILEVMPDGFGFIRCENYLPGDDDVYVSPAQVRKFNLKTGDIITGNIRISTGPSEKFSALLYVSTVNGFPPSAAQKRSNFEDMTPIFPNERIHLENANSNGISMRILDLLAPVGKGQRGMIVSPPKTGKTTLLKQIAKSISRTYRDTCLIVLLIDERPEEVTDIRESIEGPNVEVIYSTFDELPEHHKRVSEMVLERAKRLVEHKKDVVILLDSITRLARAYNLTIPPSGRTLSGGLDPAALYMPKKFFGAARNMREGGSLTILATALVETGSKMDEVVFEEFKGTGNMELVLNRSLSEKRIFPAIDIVRSGTRREDLLLSEKERNAVTLIHRELTGNRPEEATEQILNLFLKTKNNAEFVDLIMRSFHSNSGK